MRVRHAFSDRGGVMLCVPARERLACLELGMKGELRDRRWKDGDSSQEDSHYWQAGGVVCVGCVGGSDHCEEQLVQ